MLVDANVLLEAALEQDRQGEARRFLEAVDPDAFYVSEFGLYTAGIVMEREGTVGGYAALVRDVDRAAARSRLPATELALVPAEARRLGLDFDDAYHHTLASLLDVPIVSFDDDFDGTPQGRLRPRQARERDSAS